MNQYKVLLIEDDEVARTMLEQVINKEGFEVITAENGKVGLEIFENESVDIVMSDLKMPEVGGMDVLKKLKQMSPYTPFILITAFGETETAIECLKLGAIDYIKKPLDLTLVSLSLGRASEKVAEHASAQPFPSILLAEDDETTRSRLAKVLEKEGWQVSQAENGEESLKTFQEIKIDVLLTDIKMPKMDGLSSLHEMRKITNDFEAIILTGFGDESSAIKAMRDGAMNFLKKPIDIDNLVVLIEKAIESINKTRALKYRNREIELNKEIIAKITPQKEIVVDIRDEEQTDSKTFAQSLIDSIPIALAAVDKDSKVHFANRSLTAALEYDPTVVDEKFIKDLERVGIQNLEYEQFLTAFKKSKELPMGEFEIVEISKYAYIILTPISFLSKNSNQKLMLITIRGERKQAK